MTSDLILHLNEITVDMAIIMFDCSLTSSSETELCSRPGSKDRFIVLVSLGNANFQGQIVIGFPESVMESEILNSVLDLAEDEDEKDELIQSSLGELVNTISGEYIVHDELTRKYGDLTLSPPLVWDQTEESCPRFTKSDGCSGRVKSESDSMEINTFFSVNPIKKVSTYGI